MDSVLALEALGVAVSAGVPVLLWGSPGTGKTSAVVSLGESLGWPVETVIGSIREPSDFAGLPVVIEGSVQLSPPGWATRLCAAGEGLLFLDELTTAPPAVQAAMLRVVLERVVGDTRLPSGVRIVAAANPPDEAADGWELAAPLANRLVHLDWPVDGKYIAKGLAVGFPRPVLAGIENPPSAAQTMSARAAVGAFLEVRPPLALAIPRSAADAGRGWPSPRSWEAVARLLAACEAAHASEEARAALVVGAVGDGAALEFLSWLEHLDLPDPEAVLDDPGSFVLPERSDRAFAVLTAVEELGFWLLHQVSHLLREHGPRYPGSPAPEDGGGLLGARTEEQRRWNLAGDAEINDDLHTEQLVLPDGAPHPSWFELPEGWLAEQYWDALAASEVSSGRDCGSGCDGQPRGWDCDRPGLGALSARLVARDTARRIHEHTRRRGSTPAGWERWADELMQPTINWRRELAAQVRRGAADVTGRVDFTYRRPSRRASAVPDVVLPSLRQPLPQVAMVIDTSGSMSDSMLSQALAEVTGVLRSLGVARRNLRVIACDARAYEAQRVRDVKAIRLAGGGGTDMGAGLDAAAALRPRPDLIVVLTDGYTPWPPAPAGGIRVVVGLMDRGGSTPEWAQTVLIEDAVGSRR